MSNAAANPNQVAAAPAVRLQDVAMKRLAFLANAVSRDGRPYIWGAKGPSEFDCSGLVTWALKESGGPDWRATHNSDLLWKTLPPIEKPAPGDLAFYGKPDRATHVMVVVGDGRVFGACGGNQHTTTTEAAIARGARVRFRSRVDYRFLNGKSDFLGFRSLSQFLDKE